MFGRASAGYDRLLEKATSHLLLEPDWDSILSICDCIRQGDVQAKYVLSSIKKKVSSENPHVSMFALEVLESVVKNCGSSIHQELATKEFMEFIKDIIKVRGDPVKGKLLELVQTWAHAFRNEASYKAVLDTFHLLKMEGHTFPTLKEADVMFLSEKAPEWKDGECCHRCRVQFTLVQRKHHCRNCGQVFCNKCSSKNSIIPRFGIEREVRVCETCFENLNKAAGTKTAGEDDLPVEYLNSPLAQQSQKPVSAIPPSRSETELQEEEELQLAIALSKSEAETKGKERDRLRNSYTSYGSSSGADTKSDQEPIYAQPTKLTAPMMDTSEMDPELARYLNRNYWEQKQDDSKTGGMQPSAPPGTNDAGNTNSSTEDHPQPATVAENYQNGEVNEDESQFLNALSSSIEIFCNRMRSNSQRGRSVANDSSVQTLFMTINAMHPQLMKYVQKQEDSRAHYEGLQDKLAQLKDAREALNSLRDEHLEKRRREAEELDRQRQIAMAQKLEVMRQKKQEYLEFQRQLALQRMQDQEREMALRLEQQKHMQQMRVMQQYGYGPQGPPQMYSQPGQQTFSPSGSLESSPLHHPHPQNFYSPDGGQGQMPHTGPPHGHFPPGPQPVGHPRGQPPYHPINTGYQPPVGADGNVQQFQPPSQMGQPGPQGYAIPGGIDYNAPRFNMHGMAASLPGQPGPQFQHQPGQQPHTQAPHMGQQPGHPGQQPGQQMGQQPGQHPGQQPGQHPGQYTGQQPGPQPTLQQGQQPGQQPGPHPGQQPGQLPGQPGQLPGQSGPQPGQQPGQPEQVMPPGTGQYMAGQFQQLPGVPQPPAGPGAGPQQTTASESLISFD